MVTEGRLGTDFVTYSHYNAELPKFLRMADYLQDCADAAAEEVPRKTFNMDMKE